MTARRRTVVIAVFSALVLGGCSGGGGGDDAAPTTLPTTPLPPGPSVDTTTTTPGDIETFEIFTSKNPFTPLVGDTTGGTAPSPGATTPGGATGGTGGETGTASTTPGGEVTGGVEPQAAQRVSLLDVFTENGTVKANVRVNNTAHEVGVGDEFATRYKVLSLDAASECGRFLFGDDSFRLCRGDSALK